MANKLDMNKAYDMVERSYLEMVMRKLGFNEQWVNLLMLCVLLQSHILFWWIGNLKARSIQQGAFAKDIHSRLFYFYYAQKDYMVS